jgi:Ca2+-binding EF-hand superfamily protein
MFRDILNEADLDGDGEIDFEEFKAMMKKLVNDCEEKEKCLHKEMG